MTADLLREWDGILAGRRKNGASGQDGSDFAVWLKFRGVPNQPVQMELFT